MYQSQVDLEKLLADTENSYQKIFESIKTLLTVVKKQEKTLVDRWINLRFYYLITDKKI